MGLNYQNLDHDTRAFMVEELQMTVTDGKIYLSNYLSDAGKHDWLMLLEGACKAGTDITLAAELRKNGRMLAKTMRRKPKGGHTEADVPITAQRLTLWPKVNSTDFTFVRFVVEH
jgi:hypothetical protein